MYSTTINTLKEQLARAEADRDHWREIARDALADLAKAHAVIMRHLDRTQGEKGGNQQKVSHM